MQLFAKNSQPFSMHMHENSSGLSWKPRELSGHCVGIQAPVQQGSTGNPAPRLNATAQEDCFYKQPSPKAPCETDAYCIGFFRTKMHDGLW